MTLQIIFLIIPSWLFVLVCWMLALAIFFIFLLYKENKRWKHLSDLSHWGYHAVIDAAKRSYLKTTSTAAARWELFMEDIQAITKTMRDEKGKK